MRIFRIVSIALAAVALLGFVDASPCGGCGKSDNNADKNSPCGGCGSNDGNVAIVGIPVMPVPVDFSFYSRFYKWFSYAFGGSKTPCDEPEHTIIPDESEEKSSSESSQEHNSSSQESESNGM